MPPKHTLATLVTVIAAVLVAGAAAAATAPGHASLVIRHQVRGCHSWSVNGSPFRASQAVSLRLGGWITVTNNDIMPHQLVETSGPAAQIAHRSMAHIGATAKVRFAHKGVYRFTTRAGEDYKSMHGMETVGEDNVLRLTVRIS
jgi:plastocyanin